MGSEAFRALLPPGVRIGEAITADIIERIALAEREACVAVCRGLFHKGHHPALRRGADRCAIAIQMRGNVIETSSREDVGPVSAC